MPDLNSYFINSFWIVVSTILISVLFLWLFIIGGHKYSVEDTESHAEEYGELIREGHGGMTMFLWISFVVLFVWTIYYFIINLDQFLEIFA